MYILFSSRYKCTSFLSKVKQICASRKVNPQLFNYFEYVELRADYLVRPLILHGGALFHTAAGN